MMKLYICLLRWICKKLVKQGFEHKYNITLYYKVMWEEARKEMCEDTPITLLYFLQECFINASSEHNEESEDE
jgi:hypothetical protein